MYIQATGVPVLPLGRQGENLVTEVGFVEAALWPALYGEGRFELVHRRPGDVAFYPVPLSMVDNVPVWTVTRADLDKPSAPQSFGEAIMRYTDGDLVKKSQTYHTIIIPSDDSNQTDPPDPAKPWVDQVLQAASDINRKLTGGKTGQVLTKTSDDDGDYEWAPPTGGGGGVSFTTDETLKLVDGVLGVNTAEAVEEDNTLPITSAAVHTTVGNIELLLKTI